MAHRFTRQELHDLVWAEPMKKLASKFGLSDVAVAKACRRADIPVPERGYWARLQAGKSVIKPPLPPRGLGMSDVVSFGENPFQSHAELVAELLNELTPAAPTFNEDLSLVTERVRKIVGRVTAPRDFTRSHPLIARLLDADDKWRERQATSSFQLSSDGPFFDSLPERRRLRILNGLFLAFQRCGCRPWIRDRQARETGLEVGQQNVSFTLETIAERQHARRAAVPAGTKMARRRLRLTVPVWDLESMTARPGQTWEEAKGTPIERQLADVVMALIVTGEANYRKNAQAHHEWRIKRKAELEEEARKRKEEEARRERERLAKLEKERVERLLNDAANWRRACELRAYVEAVRSANPTAAAARLDQWALPILAEADRIDPIRASRLRVDDAGGEAQSTT